HTPVSVSGITDASAIALGPSHTCALLDSGAVRCWGYNEYGQLGDGSTADRHTPVPVIGITDASALALGDAYTCALLDSGAVRCWGNNSGGKLGDGSTTDRHTPVPVIGMNDASAIAVGYDHTCAALRYSSAVRCLGNNDFGQLGDGSTIMRQTPVEVLVSP
ncbi:MAG: hypothetical protein OSB21_09075, partial [Myxococcota bacterium]|nr:hypothetical protein [Myxococcota bacterium]